MKIKKSHVFIYRGWIGFLLIDFLIFLFSNKVKADPIDLTEEENQKIIYLTFDDGPSILTNNILDILKGKNIKATFF